MNAQACAYSQPVSPAHQDLTSRSQVHSGRWRGPNGRLRPPYRCSEKHSLLRKAATGIPSAIAGTRRPEAASPDLTPSLQRHRRGPIARPRAQAWWLLDFDLALHPGMNGAEEVEGGAGRCGDLDRDALVRAGFLDRDAVADAIETRLALVEDPVDDRVVLVGWCLRFLRCGTATSLDGYIADENNLQLTRLGSLKLSGGEESEYRVTWSPSTSA
jgi:hypothetical protein